MSTEMKLSPYFPLSDISCKCGCEQKTLHPLLYGTLITAREDADIPFPILSWNRCVKHNEIELGSKTSSHLKGWAVDIACVNSAMRMIIVRALLNAGFTRVGVYSWGIHIDMDPKKGGGVLWVG